jgi:hypothetical protein
MDMDKMIIMAKMVADIKMDMGKMDMAKMVADIKMDMGKAIVMAGMTLILINMAKTVGDQTRKAEYYHGWG